MNDEDLVLKQFKINKSTSDTQYRMYESLPLCVGGSYNGVYDLNTQVTTVSGVRLDMMEQDFESLMRVAAIGIHHSEYQKRHPGLRDLYQQYMMMYYLLTKQDMVL